MREITLTGRLAADAQKKMSKNGNEFITFRMASTEYWDDKDSEGKPITQWYSVIAFNPTPCFQQLKKGRIIHVTGLYKDSTYVSNKTGNVEISREINASIIGTIDSGDRRNNENNTTNNVPNNVPNNMNEQQQYGTVNYPEQGYQNQPMEQQYQPQMAQQIAQQQYQNNANYAGNQYQQPQQSQQPQYQQPQYQQPQQPQYQQPQVQVNQDDNDDLPF